MSEMPRSDTSLVSAVVDSIRESGASPDWISVRSAAAAQTGMPVQVGTPHTGPTRRQGGGEPTDDTGPDDWTGLF